MVLAFGLLVCRLMKSVIVILFKKLSNCYKTKGNFKKIGEEYFSFPNTLIFAPFEIFILHHRQILPLKMSSSMWPLWKGPIAVRNAEPETTTFGWSLLYSLQLCVSAHCQSNESCFHIFFCSFGTQGVLHEDRNQSKAQGTPKFKYTAKFREVSYLLVTVESFSPFLSATATFSFP